MLADNSKNLTDAESQCVNDSDGFTVGHDAGFCTKLLALRGWAPFRRSLVKTFIWISLFQPRELSLDLFQNSYYIVQLPLTKISCCDSSFLRLSGFTKPPITITLQQPQLELSQSYFSLKKKGPGAQLLV